MISVTQDIAACRALRRTVFIEEQGIAEADEWDDLDQIATHLIAHESGRACGTARVYLQDGIGKIGRVCVLEEARGTGLGAALIRASMSELSRMGATRARLGAQTHAIAFYEKLGFTAFGPEYDDAGIPHRDMEAPLASSSS